MAGGLLGTRRAYDSIALDTLDSAADNERAIKSENKMAKAGGKQQQASMIGTGAGLGALMASGATAGTFAGPGGMALGALAGAAAGMLLGDFL